MPKAKQSAGPMTMQPLDHTRNDAVPFTAADAGRWSPDGQSRPKEPLTQTEPCRAAKAQLHAPHFAAKRRRELKPYRRDSARCYTGSQFREVDLAIQFAKIEPVHHPSGGARSFAIDVRISSDGAKPSSVAGGLGLGPVRQSTHVYAEECTIGR
jgi:hypothetical protein